MQRIGLAAVLACQARRSRCGQADAVLEPDYRHDRQPAAFARRDRTRIGDNVAVGDADGVDHDERVKIVTCRAGGTTSNSDSRAAASVSCATSKVDTGKVFSVEDKELTACNKK